MPRRRIRNSGMGGEALKKTQTRNFLHRVAPKATITGMYSDGTAIATLPTGKYTYQFFQIGITSKIAIAGVTIEKAGKHFVQTEHLADYIENVTLEIDGTPERDLDMAEFIEINGYRKLDVMDGFVFMPFGGPNLFVDERQEDAYMLGTQDVRDLRLLFELTAAWDETNMSVSVQTEYVPVSRKLEWIETHKTQRYTASAAGKFTISDLPVHADLAAILVSGPGINHAKLTIDNEVLFDGNAYELEAALALYGQDTTALGDHVMFDFWRGMEATKGLAGLRSAAQRKRNADIRLELDLANANTELKVTLLQCGRYRTQH